jgi:hypothetical protein
MHSKIMSHKITHTLLGAVFFLVSTLSLYLSTELTWEALLFALFKGIIAIVFAWLFFLILSDTILKSIMTTMSGMSDMRKEGGLIYHLIKPAENEIIPERKKVAKKRAKKVNKK